MAVGVVMALPMLAPAAGPGTANGRGAEWTHAFADDRILRTEIVVRAPIDDVWRAWTTEAGIASFFGCESNIELALSGPYELYMGMKEPDESGLRGSEGCRVLSYVPREMLAFEWSFPPAIMSLRKAGAKTQVVLRFRQTDAGVKVSFAQLGWQKGDDWDAGYAYFSKAWPMVMKWMKDALEKQASGSAAVDETKRAATDKGRRVSQWSINDIDVTLSFGPDQYQSFEVTLPVSVDAAWNLLATTEGFQKLGGAEARVDLRPGGNYTFWPGAPNRVLAFVPHEVLSTSGSAPPEFPNVRKGGTWGSYFFEPAGENRTRLRLVVVGWRPGEDEWDRAFEYFAHNNPIWLNMVRSRAREDAGVPEDEGVDRVTFTVNASRDAVWKAWTTAEGLSAWMAPHADIDARKGGKMRVNYNADGALGDPQTIENTVLALKPRRLMTIRATKCPEGFPYSEAIKTMKTEIRLKDAGPGATQVSFVGSGFTDDEESKKMRSHFRRGNVVTARRLQDHFAGTGVDR